MAGWLGRLFHRKKDEPLRCTAVVAAAGSSARMEGQDKLLLILGEQPVLVHTLRALELCPYITEIVIVTREEPDRTRWAAVQGLCLFQGEQGHRGGRYPDGFGAGRGTGGGGGRVPHCRS